MGRGRNAPGEVALQCQRVDWATRNAALGDAYVLTDAYCLPVVYVGVTRVLSLAVAGVHGCPQVALPNLPAFLLLLQLRHDAPQEGIVAVAPVAAAATPVVSVTRRRRSSWGGHAVVAHGVVCPHLHGLPGVVTLISGLAVRSSPCIRVGHGSWRAARRRCPPVVAPVVALIVAGRLLRPATVPLLAAPRILRRVHPRARAGHAAVHRMAPGLAIWAASPVIARLPVAARRPLARRRGVPVGLSPPRRGRHRLGAQAVQGGVPGPVPGGARRPFGMPLPDLEGAMAPGAHGVAHRRARGGQVCEQEGRSAGMHGSLGQRHGRTLKGGPREGRRRQDERHIFRQGQELGTRNGGPGALGIHVLVARLDVPHGAGTLAAAVSPAVGPQNAALEGRGGGSGSSSSTRLHPKGGGRTEAPLANCWYASVVNRFRLSCKRGCSSAPHATHCWCVSSTTRRAPCPRSRSPRRPSC